MTERAARGFTHVAVRSGSETLVRHRTERPYGDRA